ncbi:hypothetical protein OAL59_05825 [Nitrosopumilus sp.]|nr:hypothetical protein [Nitrosopumilus sp.]
MTADSSSQWNGDGIHKITGTKYDELRFDIEGNNRRGFNRDGIHKITNQKWDEEDYDYRLFHKDTGINKHTRTKCAEDGYDLDGYDK